MGRLAVAAGRETSALIFAVTLGECPHVPAPPPKSAEPGAQEAALDAAATPVNDARRAADAKTSTATRSGSSAGNVESAEAGVTSLARCDEGLATCRPEYACSDDQGCLEGSRCSWGCCTPLPIVGCEIVLPAPIGWKARRSWDLAPMSSPILDQVAETLLRFEDVVAGIDVHDASTGAEKYTRIPTQKRADAVRQHLEARGVPRSRLVARGWDSQRPIATNKTREGREQNRRVEIALSVPAECVESLGPRCGPVRQEDWR